MADLIENYYRPVEETENFLLIDKLPGVVAQGVEHSLFSHLSRLYPDTGLFPVHRLDKITSGLMLLAKNSQAARELSNQFAVRQTDKFYLAISDRKPRKKQGGILGDMAAARRGSWKLLKTTENPAFTQFFSESLSPGKRLFLLRPLTGKTHQLRVALKSIGAPILGDQRYGSSGADRGYLHAFALGFNFQGNYHSYQCLPREGKYFQGTDFQRALAGFRMPRELPWPRTRS